MWIGLGVLILLSPLGLLLPEHFKAGAAWGEWGIDEIKKLAGYFPKGLEKLAPLWNAPLSDYAFKGWEGKGLSHLSLAYVISAVVGIAVTVGASLLVGKLLAKKGK
ncbi:MAG: PDGLE domain-containing protein [Deltaproteobacteria bacterium]|nr:PDGLE domain-containing protein [Deltaproteobacteria bacterium]